jgi:hypothetical protein
MNEVPKWKIAVAVFVVALITVLAMSNLPFDDLKKESDRKVGTLGILADFFYGLAKM